MSNKNPIDMIIIGTVKLIIAAEERFPNIANKLDDLEESSIQFKKAHPVLNIGKQLLIGTVKGLFGAYHRK